MISSHYNFSNDSILFPGNPLLIRHQIPKLPIVHLHPVIQIKAYLHIGMVVQFIIKVL
ncbi:hypothetical protein MTBBW1_200013 [Desulfamplus magnetovallimortis]|uniref:Uncharacterized protein n=1 Tax=Desulfamplus magnetovallimortis TaxID=1246637 RepID=A0A1W1HBR2_9BACT|nr:hypothetical protein MTBBW1_200013 [Desulfamplus magnetovallimortis]